MSEFANFTSDYVSGEVEVVFVRVEQGVHKHGQKRGIYENGNPSQLQNSHFLLGLGLQSEIRGFT
jgi:hypothetical protein